MAIAVAYSSHIRQKSTGSKSVAKAEIRGFPSVPCSLGTAREYVFPASKGVFRDSLGHYLRKGTFVKKYRSPKEEVHKILSLHEEPLAAKESRVGYLQGCDPW